MLKLARIYGYGGIFGQPPSGGCVLKLGFLGFCQFGIAKPAAFRRLCVETSVTSSPESGDKPAAFRRLCVETR